MHKKHVAMFNRASRNMTQSMFCFLCSLNERNKKERTDCSLSLLRSFEIGCKSLRDK